MRDNNKSKSDYTPPCLAVVIILKSHVNIGNDIHDVNDKAHYEKKKRHLAFHNSR